MSATTENRMVKPLPVLGLSRKEQREYSITKALRHLMLTAEGQRSDPGLEWEASQALQKLTGRGGSGGLLVPTADLAWRRDNILSAGGSGSGLVPTVLSGDFIEALRSKCIVSQAGATYLDKLTGNLDLPRQTTTTQSYWLSEGETIPETNLNIGLVSLRPKTVAAIVPATRRLLLQSSLDVEAIVREDLTKQIAQAIDLAAISGSGQNNEPLGLLNNPGIEVHSLGSNGGSLSWADVVELESIVAAKNGDANLGNPCYLASPAVKGKMKTTAKVVGQDVFLWESQLNPQFNPIDPSQPPSFGMVNNCFALSSNQIPSDLTKGNASNLSALIFGDFTQMLLGLWGVLEILPNQFGAGYGQGVIQIRAMSDVDVALRHTESFAFCADIVTT